MLTRLCKIGHVVATVNVQDAKTQLSGLLRRAEAGEEVIIARAGTPIARLLALSPRLRSFDTPLLDGPTPGDLDAALEPLDASELESWEQGFMNDPLNA